MVDLGEYASIEGTTTPDYKDWYDKMKVEFPDFVQSSYDENTPLSDSQITDKFNKVDIAYISCHGSYSIASNPEYQNALYSGNYWSFNPTDVCWSNDSEWLTFAACSVLAIDLPAVEGVEVNSEAYRNWRSETPPAPEGGKSWAKTLMSSKGSPTHCILGFRGGSYGEPNDSDVAEDFVNYLKAGETVREAWMQANLDNPITSVPKGSLGDYHYYSTLNAVSLMHTENVDDKLKEVTRDVNNGNFTYDYIAWVYDEREPNDIRLLQPNYKTTTFSIAQED